MQVSQGHGKCWSAAQPLKRCASLRFKAFSHLVRWEKLLVTLKCSRSHSVCFFWPNESTAIRARARWERSLSLHPRAQTDASSGLWTWSDCDQTAASTCLHALLFVWLQSFTKLSEWWQLYDNSQTYYMIMHHGRLSTLAGNAKGYLDCLEKTQRAHDKGQSVMTWVEIGWIMQSMQYWCWQVYIGGT